MRKIMITTLAFCAMASTGAMAADMTTASAGTCTDMATQVNAALNANQSSSNLADATKERNYGRDFCANSMYKNGVAHYAQALKILGVSAS